MMKISVKWRFLSGTMVILASFTALSLLFPLQGAAVTDPGTWQSQLQHSIRHQVEPWLTPDDDIKIEILRPTALPVTPQPWTFDSPLSQHFTSRCIVTAHSGTFTIGIPVHLILRRPVWVVTSAVQAGETLQADKLKADWREVNGTSQQWLGRHDDVSALQARLCMFPGEVLDRRKVGAPILVQRQNPVTVELVDGDAGIELTFTGQAMQEGQLGQQIHIQQDNGSGKRTYTATVTGRQRVRVAL